MPCIEVRSPCMTDAAGEWWATICTHPYHRYTSRLYSYCQTGSGFRDTTVWFDDEAKAHAFIAEHPALFKDQQIRLITPEGPKLIRG